jgi:ADP-heptose:LPS heptosyltransferase
MVHEQGVLLIHMGALGDICVSESTFLSLHHMFGKKITALGSRRILLQFNEYFNCVESIDARKWAYLFSGSMDNLQWHTIILIGKDPHELLRQRLPYFSGKFIFIDMYPDNEKISAEEYQLAQLPFYGIEPIRRQVRVSCGRNVFLYPEQSCKKTKWPIYRFVRLYEILKIRGLDPLLLRQKGLELPSPVIEMPESLDEVARLFSQGGVFVSNDSGMAHFAARYGMQTITIFHDEDPRIWQPRNSIVIRGNDCHLTEEDLADMIISLRATDGNM